jgi:branched-chain amino acid transport system permease protein
MDVSILAQQLIIGLNNGLIIALLAIGYTMVYGIVEMINFAHGDVFMLGAFLALTILGLFDEDFIFSSSNNLTVFLILLATVPLFCGLINWSVDRFAYRSLRKSPKLVTLVTAIGVSFILMNIGLFWGGLPFSVFGHSAAAPKDFPSILSSKNYLGKNSFIFITDREAMVVLVTVPLLLVLTYLVKYTKLGKAMRAVAQNSEAAALVGIDVNKIIGLTFFIGGLLAGIAAIVFSFYNNTIHFQMGYRAGMDAFAAAVLGGIGSLTGAFLGGVFIGFLRSLSDGYLSTTWTNVTVFMAMIVFLLFKPSGLLGKNLKDKV